MIRRFFIERVLRQIYGQQPVDDSSISVNLVNAWLPDAIATAAKQNYKENVALDGIGYVNNSFYSRFSGITISNDNGIRWKATLPEIPIGIGANEGVSTIELYDSSQRLFSKPLIPLTEAQKTVYQNIRTVPNKTLYYYEGNQLYIISTLMMNLYTMSVTMVSGGDSTNLDSTIIVPADYFPIIVEYIKQQLVFEQSRPIDVSNDGVDSVNPVA